AVKARQQVGIIGLPATDDLPRDPLWVHGLAPAAATLEPAQGIEHIILLQPFLGITVAASEQRAQYAGLRPGRQRPAAAALPATAQARMYLRVPGLYPALAGIIAQQKWSIGHPTLDGTPLPATATAPILLHGEAVPQAATSAQWRYQRRM